MMNQIHHTLSDVSTHVTSVLTRRAERTADWKLVYVKLKAGFLECVALLSQFSLKIHLFNLASFC